MGAGGRYRPAFLQAIAQQEQKNTGIMTTNVGTLDRIVRIVLAISCSILYFTGAVSGTSGVVLLVVGAVLLVTAVLGWCGLYAMLGVSTCPVRK